MFIQALHCRVNVARDHGQQGLEMMVVRRLYVHGSGEGTILVRSDHHIDSVTADGFHVDAVQSFLLVICQGPVFQKETVVPRVHCCSVEYRDRWRVETENGCFGAVQRER